MASRIRQELLELALVVQCAEEGWRRALVSADDYHTDAVALNLHGFYAGLERLFELIASRLDQATSSGPSWHQELLRQMSAEVPSLRPPVLTSETRDRVDRYRGFRHVIRNVYTFNLDPEEIESLVRRLRPTFERVEEELLTFADFLEQLARADEEE